MGRQREKRFRCQKTCSDGYDRSPSERAGKIGMKDSCALEIDLDFYKMYLLLPKIDGMQAKMSGLTEIQIPDSIEIVCEQCLSRRRFFSCFTFVDSS